MGGWITPAAAEEYTSPLSEPQQYAFMLLLGVLFTLGGLHFLRRTARNIIRARRSRSWPRVPGIVTGHALRRPALNGQSVATPQVQYEYTCDGATYRNDAIMFGGHSPYGPALAQAVLDRYPIGSAVSVVHDPLQPATSALESKAAYAVPLTYGLSFLTAGLLHLAVWATSP